MNEYIKKGLIHYPSNHGNSAMNLICFPFAGGGTLCYGKWRADLHPGIELFALNLPGRERFWGAPCFSNYSELIFDLAKLISDMPAKPLVFFGHSFGGLTAYFTSLALKKYHFKHLKQVIVSARVPPSMQQLSHIGALDDELFLQNVIDRYQGIPKEVLESPELLQMFLPIIKQDFQLYEQYPQVFSMYEDKKITADLTTLGYEEDAVARSFIDAWSTLTTGNYLHHQLPGGHFALLTKWQPVVKIINELYKNIFIK